jgi:hypothetical protein
MHDSVAGRSIEQRFPVDYPSGLLHMNWQAS